MKKLNIVIVGNGFGAVYTALNLKKVVKAGLANVTLIGRKNHFLFTPLLHEVATGGLHPSSIVEPIREILRNTDIRFIEAEVDRIDVKNRTISALKMDLSYDYLVLASGAVTNDFNVAGVKENANTLKTLIDAVDLRNKIIDTVEKVTWIEDPVLRRKNLAFTVIGGGPTGVELVAEIEEFICENLYKYYQTSFHPDEVSIKLITNTSTLLGTAPAWFGIKADKILKKKGIEIIYNANVKKVGNTEVVYTEKDGAEKSFDSMVTVWVGGVKPQTPVIEGDILKNKGGRIIVGGDLSIQSLNALNTGVFVIGDISAIEVNGVDKSLPMLAQVAVQQGNWLGKFITKKINNPVYKSEFTYKNKGNLISIGRFEALGEVYGFKFSGPIMWFLWRTVYLWKFISWRKKIRIMIDWFIDLFSPRDITRL